MFANSQAMGIDMGFPDACFTPPSPVPVPYPNIAAGPMAVKAVNHVLFGGTPAHNLSTEIPITNGDNAAAAGVASGRTMGKSRHLTGAFTVLVGGAPATRVTSVSLQNVTNCPGVRLAPSQFKVLLLAP